MHTNLTILLTALLLACSICEAEQALPRKYYGAKLEPVSHVLHTVTAAAFDAAMRSAETRAPALGEAIPVNPGFTPEQAGAMEQMIRSSSSAAVLYSPEAKKPASVRAAIRIDGASNGRRWCGIGSTPATAMERQLMFYPEKERDYILDLMFKPKFGMALTHLKVEVGGDNNSTAAVEPSFAHTREELKQPNFRRGGNFWLMKKARERNPSIELGALAWTQPYWVGDGSGRSDNKSFFTQESADYFAAFFKGARDVWGLEMQFFSAEQNERHPGGRRDWVVNQLRPTFDKAGLKHVGFVIDNAGWPLSREDNDPILLKQTYALGRHYVENSKHHISTPEAQASGLPLWNAEGWSREGRTWPLAIYFAESVVRCYVDSKVTQFTTWPILAGGLPGSLYGSTGLMQANKPWSGYYEIYPTVWITAHYNQFAPLGWQTVDGGCGGLFFEENLPYDRWTLGAAGNNDAWPRHRLNYMTLKSPDSQDYSVIVVNSSPFARTLDLELAGLPDKPLYKWLSTESAQFINQGEQTLSRGRLTLGIEPWSICTLTTTTGQRKGDSSQHVPEDTVLPLPYSDNFDAYTVGGDARYSSCSAGYFEVYQAPGESKTLRQCVPAKGLTWSIPKDNYPCVAIGDIRWGDYEVSADARLEGEGWIALWARVARFRDHGMSGYYLRVSRDGTWELGVAQSRHSSVNFYTEKALAAGKLEAFNPDTWHALAIAADGDQLQACVDGVHVGSAKDSLFPCGAVGFSTWAEGIQRDREEMKSAMVIGQKYGQARYDNLQVRPIPGKVSQHGWKATATTAHAGFEAAKAIDGDIRTFWHSEYNSLGPLPQALTVDLGQSRKLREVRVIQRQDGGHSYITRYELHLSEDGQIFTKVAEGTWADDAGMKTISVGADSQAARFIRVEALEASARRKNNVSIAEVHVIEGEQTNAFQDK